MSWIATTLAVASFGMDLYGRHKKGKTAAGQDISGMKKAATGVKDAETKSAWEEYSIQKQQQFDDIQGNVMASADESSKSLMKAFLEQSTLAEGTGFAGSGAVDTAIATSKKDIRERHSGVIESLEKGYTYTSRAMDLSQQKSLAQIEQRFQSKLDEISSINSTYSEGFWG